VPAAKQQAPTQAQQQAVGGVAGMELPSGDVLVRRKLGILNFLEGKSIVVVAAAAAAFQDEDVHSSSCVAVKCLASPIPVRSSSSYCHVPTYNKIYFNTF
jgi:hypothetical protein